MTNIFKRGWININITMGITSFANYINEMEDFLSSQLRELEEQLEHDTKNVDSEEAQYIFEYQYEDQIYYLREEFPNILRRSFIISIYSFLEQELNRICLHLEKNNKFEITLENLTNDNGIFNAYKFLSEIAKVNVNSVDYEWKKIIKINKIRNHFVHNGDDILNKVMKPKSIKEIKGNQTLYAFQYFNLAKEDKIYTEFRNSKEDTKKYDVKIPQNFCKETINIIGIFFDKLTRTLKVY